MVSETNHLNVFMARDYNISVARDEHGQPLRPLKFLRHNNNDKAIDQLSGLCLGILADGPVNDAEAEFLKGWLNQVRHMATEWPFSEIFRRIDTAFSESIDGKTRNEQLTKVLTVIVGDGAVEDPANSHSSELPFDSILPDPLPIMGREFVLTGRFAKGPRSHVSEMIESSGGKVKGGFPSVESDFLVIGSLSSRDWQFSSYGRKIERAVDLRNIGGKILIIPEKHLIKFLV